MSVKFEKETVRDTANVRGGKHDIAHSVGEALTGGKGQTGYLAVCISFKSPLLPAKKVR